MDLSFQRSTLRFPYLARRILSRGRGCAFPAPSPPPKWYIPCPPLCRCHNPAGRLWLEMRPRTRQETLRRFRYCDPSTEGTSSTGSRSMRFVFVRLGVCRRVEAFSNFLFPCRGQVTFSPQEGTWIVRFTMSGYDRS